MASVSLVTVVNGEVYERYARDLFLSAARYFRPGSSVQYLSLPGREGWPQATLYRYHALLQYRGSISGSYVFMSDADMRFEGKVGSEVLSELVATLHPGYIGKAREELPYENRPEAAAYIKPEQGERYYCGGFVGGRKPVFLALARKIANAINRDEKKGLVARWHDESHLNRQLLSMPPTLALPPSYCYPDNDAWYQTFWPDSFPRKLVALDKSADERGGR